LKLLLKIGLLAISAFSIELHAADKPLEFFEEYVRLGESFDPQVVHLYSDQALIHAYRVYPHGLERNMQLSGIEWKQLVTRVMSLAKAKNDKSTFSNVAVTEISEGYKIKADRYSVRKCYTDTGYYMIIKASESGMLKIFEEYMETKPLPNC